jgi:hypothetical protein
MNTIRHCRDINSRPFLINFRQFTHFAIIYHHCTNIQPPPIVFSIVDVPPAVPVFQESLIINIAMSQPPTVQITGVPPVLEASHERILELEKKARATHELWISICKIMEVLQLQKFGTPLEVFKRIYEFVLRSLDIADCGEPCVSLGGFCYT